MNTLSVSVNEKITSKDGLLSNGIVHYRGQDNCLYSVYPPTAYLSFGNWIYMVPPFKPDNILMLGYAGGTVAGLIQLLYGKEIPITGFDTAFADNRYDVNLISSDAREFVKICKPFQCVIIDI